MNLIEVLIIFSYFNNNYSYESEKQTNEFLTTESIL